ncbi:MAG: succinylglutamate-semialdehyde dehydrogenase [Verrucomicrobia bacterium]|jgi:succinylglutamic semialdehyde dehydrogenase|nr:succinylglutamate-semialdehyde dehydrogenase [Verrucomicrobiota bacterium]
MSTDRILSYNPADGSVLGEYKTAGEEAIREAVSAARSAFPDWSRAALPERAAILRRFAEILGERTEELARTLAREIGKPLWEARTEVKAMAAKVEISIRAQRNRCAGWSEGKLSVEFRPHGVVAVLGPYNFPGHLPNGHICPALLAGNSVLFKPSELAPATAEATLACWREAGLPRDVLQVLQGGPATASLLLEQEEIDGVFFTGSAATGKHLARRFADTPGKILALEMGGNNPLLVDLEHIADPEAARGIILRSAFLSTGQRCTCARRLILPESADVERFLADLAGDAASLRIDEPFADPEPFMGPLAGIDFPARVLEAVENLRFLGATTLLEPVRLHSGTGFISPGILEVSGCAGLPDEEIFGPVLQVCRVPGWAEAVEVANATRYGLAAGVLTEDEERWDYARDRLRAGILNRNQPLTGASSAAPFGGLGDSGNHRPGAYFAADYCQYPVASLVSDQC